MRSTIFTVFVAAGLAAGVRAQEHEQHIASTWSWSQGQHGWTAASSSSSSSGGAYSRGMRALDRREWQPAMMAFGEAAKQGGERADAAQYWMAYSQNKLGLREEALASLAALRKAHPTSRWLNDAGALEVEIKQSMGQPVSPESATDEDMKLMALNGLIRTDAERAMPILKKILEGAQSPRMKERAVFVLSQSSAPEARQMLGEIARGKANPDLQRQAVRSLMFSGNKENAQILAEVYASDAPAEVKKEVIRGFMMAKDKERILALAKTEKEPSLKLEAVRSLGFMKDAAGLSGLYGSESSVEVRKEILSAFVFAGVPEKLIEAANAEKEPELRKKAIQMLGMTDRAKTGEALVQLYGKESDVSVKKQVLNSLAMQGNAKPLVEIARREQDPALKKEAVQRLSMMKSSEATEYMLELLNK